MYWNICPNPSLGSSNELVRPKPKGIGADGYTDIKRLDRHIYQCLDHVKPKYSSFGYLEDIFSSKSSTKFYVGISNDPVVRCTRSFKIPLTE